MRHPVRLAALALLALAAPPAGADEFAAFPRITRPVFEALAKRCRGVGGALRVEPAAVATVRLSPGDGAPDFVLDTRFAACGGAEQPWTAPHGREVHVFLSLGAGSWVEAWKGYALDWAIVPEDGRPLFRVETRGVCAELGPTCHIAYGRRDNRLVEVARRRAD